MLLINAFKRTILLQKLTQHTVYDKHKIHSVYHTSEISFLQVPLRGQKIH